MNAFTAFVIVLLSVLAFVGIMVHVTGDSRWAWAFLILACATFNSNGSAKDASC